MNSEYFLIYSLILFLLHVGTCEAIKKRSVTDLSEMEAMEIYKQWEVKLIY